MVQPSAQPLALHELCLSQVWLLWRHKHLDKPYRAERCRCCRLILRSSAVSIVRPRSHSAGVQATYAAHRLVHAGREG